GDWSSDVCSSDLRSCARRVARVAVDWRDFKRRGDVCRDAVDASSVVAAKVGIAGRRAGGGEIRHCQLLDEQLLGWSRGGHRRRTRARGDASRGCSGTDARRPAAGTGTRGSRQYQPLRRVTFLLSLGWRVTLGAGGKNNIRHYW